MNPLFEAAWELGEFLRQNNIPYAVIGGLALQNWGDIRFTKDVDLSVATPLEEGSVGLVRHITAHFPSRISQQISLHNRMILISASNGVDVDISLSLPGYEDDMLAHTVDFEIETGKTIRLCSAEDLIIHKAVAGRPQDIADIEGIIYRQGEKLDVSHIRLWLGEFATLLENQKYRTGLRGLEEYQKTDLPVRNKTFASLITRLYPARSATRRVLYSRARMRKAGSRKALRMASARSCAFCGSTSKPFSPGFIHSRRDSISPATGKHPQAIASSSVLGVPS
jgi:hypothetical protein